MRVCGARISCLAGPKYEYISASISPPDYTSWLVQHAHSPGCFEIDLKVLIYSLSRTLPIAGAGMLPLACSLPHSIVTSAPFNVCISDRRPVQIFCCTSCSSYRGRPPVSIVVEKPFRVFEIYTCTSSLFSHAHFIPILCLQGPFSIYVVLINRTKSFVDMRAHDASYHGA